MDHKTPDFRQLTSIVAGSVPAGKLLITLRKAITTLNRDQCRWPVQVATEPFAPKIQ
jgi:hypothetical protein